MDLTDLVATVCGGFVLASVGYWLLSTAWLEAWLHRNSFNAECPATDAARLPPITFFRPLKHGVLEIREKLRAFVETVREGDQIIFGVEQGTEEEQISRALKCAFPARDLVVVRCQRTAALNPKISKLQQMRIFAQHEHWVIIDGEFMAQPGWIDGFRMEWATSECDALTAGYRLVGVRTMLQGLDALPILVSLWPGLSAVLRAGQVDFLLGAVMALRRRDLEAIGGWKRFGNDLAEDNRLGVALVAAGKKILLSRQIVPLGSDLLDWCGYWRHQRRVAVTYRVCNPAGFAGMICTHGVSWAIALLLLRPIAPFTWLIFAATVAIRWWTAKRLNRLLQFSIPYLCISTVIASVVETLCWFISWISTRVWWAGKWWTVSKDGKLLPAGPC